MRRLVVLAFVALGLVGCAATSPYMLPRKGLALGPAPAGRAQVVFIRPSSFATGLAPAILDANGTYLGESTPASYFAVLLEPGVHTFVAWSEGTHSMRAELAAGKTYYVEVAPVMGVWSARFHLKALKGPAAVEKIKTWLAETTPHEVRVAEGQAGIVNARRADADETIKKGVARFAEYNAEEAAERTLLASDGQ